MADKFIEGAIKHPGRLKNLAKREGTTVSAVAREHAHDKGGLGNAARMYQNVLAPVIARGRKKK